MTAKAHDQIRVALGDQIKRIAQVQADNRAPRAFQLALGRARKGDRGSVQFFLDTTGDDADHALMPVGLEERDSGAIAGADFAIQTSEPVQGIFLHVGFDAATFAVELVEFLGDVQRAPGIVGDQAFNAQAHVCQAAGGV